MSGTLTCFVQHTSGCAPALTAQLASVCTHARTAPHFCVIAPGLGADGRTGLERTCREFGAALEFAAPQAAGIQDYPLAALECLTHTASACGLERALVMLDDSIFMSDPAVLLETDLQGQVLAAVRDVKLMDNRRSVRALGRMIHDLSLSGPAALFDPSLLVVDCRRWLQEHRMEDLARQAAALSPVTCSGWCTTPGAQALYRLLNGDFAPLPRSWGVPYQYARLFVFERQRHAGEMLRLRFNGPPGTQPWLDPDAEGAELFYACLERTLWSTWVPSPHR